jgi:hypothetical protein
MVCGNNDNATAGRADRAPGLAPRPGRDQLAGEISPADYRQSGLLPG